VGQFWRAPKRRDKSHAQHRGVEVGRLVLPSPHRCILRRRRAATDISFPLITTFRKPAVLGRAAMAACPVWAQWLGLRQNGVRTYLEGEIRDGTIETRIAEP